MNWKTFLSMFFMFNVLTMKLVPGEGGGSGEPPQDPPSDDPPSDDPPSDDPPEDDPEDKDKGDKVSRTAYEKVLQEKKNLAKWKADQEAEAKSKKENSLKDSEKWKELYQVKEEELQREREEREALQKAIKDKTREGAVLKEFKKNNGNEKFYQTTVKKLIDFDKIVLDEDSGMAYGVEEQIKTIKKELPMLFSQGKDRHDHGGNGDPAPKGLTAAEAYRRTDKNDKRTKNQRLIDAYKNAQS